MTDNSKIAPPWLAALKAAFPHTIPILAGFWFLGIAYGLLMHNEGFAFYWPMLMAMVVFSGSVEFIAVKLLVSVFNPVQAFVITLMVCARHLFYGVSMLDKYRDTGWKKFFLIYGMCDETFAINYTVDAPKGVDRGWFMLWVTLLDMSYWATGATIGALAGNLITFDLAGLDFVMTAMFVTIFMDQWVKEKDHRASLTGLGLSALCLYFFGPEKFVVPTMISMLLVFTILRGRLEQKGGEE